MQTFANLAVVLGSIGMIYFAMKFPFSTHLWELKDDPKAHKFLGKINGYYFWLWSWYLILLGAVLQLITPWLPLIISWLRFSPSFLLIGDVFNRSVTS